MANQVVYVSTVADDDIVRESAQYAMVDGEWWSVVGHTWRRSGVSRFSRMPRVSCPVIDLSNVTDDAAVQRIMAQHVGAFDVSGMIAKLVELGAVVRPS